MDAKITVKSRDVKGSASARRLRRDGWVPGVIYSEGGVARMVSIPKHEFEQMLRHHASEHVMVKIQIEGGAEESVLLKEVQHDALSGGVEHVDMQKVDMNKKLRVEVPVELVGEADGVRNQGGVLDHLLHYLEIECFPADIPEEIDVDVTDLKLGDILTVKDIKIDGSKYTILMDADVGVAAVAAPKVAEEPVAEEAAAAAGPEVIREKKPEEETK
ncbi:MAG TPA: 50S ribosomal protein L25 [Pontiellaceae bacterium]|nr:50S ribosomal protein L25 [Pontiellaceae bacterium]HPR82391.1 50S ribosomal protein L25 [Pontiellaceae bacterium]